VPATAALARIQAVPADAFVPLEAILPLMEAITRAAACLVGLLVFLALLRVALLRGRKVVQVATWGCGYAAPSARMQYTAGSFAEPLLSPFAPVIHAQITRVGPEGYFPKTAHYEEHLGDPAGERFLVPATRRIVRGLARLRVIQQGRLQLYLVYIAVTLVVLLIWQVIEVGR
jgi:hypothetical protein